MQVEGKKLRFGNTLWVQHGGAKVSQQNDTVLVEGIDEDSYLKIFNNFGRVLKLYTFEPEAGRWIDSATGAAPAPLDETLAGHVPPPAAKAPRRAATKPRKPRTTKGAATVGAQSTPEKSARRSTPASKGRATASKAKRPTTRKAKGAGG